MNMTVKSIFTLILTVTLISLIGISVFASEPEAENTEVVAAETEDTAESSVLSSKAWSAAIIIAVASGAGALAMGMAVSKSAESISRQPEASGQIRTGMMLGLVFIETAIIYALIIAILVIFVL